MQVNWFYLFVAERVNAKYIPEMLFSIFVAVHPQRVSSCSAVCVFVPLMLPLKFLTKKGKDLISYSYYFLCL